MAFLRTSKSGLVTLPLVAALGFVGYLLAHPKLRTWYAGWCDLQISLSRIYLAGYMHEIFMICMYIYIMYVQDISYYVISNSKIRAHQTAWHGPQGVISQNFRVTRCNQQCSAYALRGLVGPEPKTETHPQHMRWKRTSASTVWVTR